VVATGHYHHPRVPDIPGLKEWKDAWPSRIQTSKSYRRPEVFADQTVLLIGAFISSTDIAKELGPFAKHIYQSNRDGSVSIPVKALPRNAERVAGTASFGPPLKLKLQETGALDPLRDGECIPASVTLADGRVINDIDQVIFCTGYHHTYPFLSSYHDDSADVKDANETVLVTDGTQVHNLHKDIFYIPDPTLSFVGLPTFVSSFTLFEFQAIAVTAVLSGKAFLPSDSEMRKEYQEECKKRRPGRAFHSLFNLNVPLEVNYVKDLVEWLNDDAKVTGGKQIEGHSEMWLTTYTQHIERLRDLFLR
jgi:cation diffusion facilitator CzcD-associated flavoprotein CzcO